MATNEELINQINQDPCNPSEVTQSIQNITNVLNNVGNGVLLARCKLTGDGMTCAPATLPVTNFLPLVPDFDAFGIAVPTEADQYLNIPIFGEKWAYIVYNPDDERWEVMPIEQTHRRALLSPPELAGRTIFFPNELLGVNVCDDTGVDEIVFSTVSVDVVTDLTKNALSIDWDVTTIEVWDVGASTPDSIPLVMARAIRQMFLDDDPCGVNYREVEMEVFAKEDLTDVNGAWDYTLVNVITDINEDEDGNITAFWYPVYVACVGTPFEEIVLYVEYCESGSGSGSGSGG